MTSDSIDADDKPCPLCFSFYFIDPIASDSKAINIIRERIRQRRVNTPKRNFGKGENAISPVIGVILVVAITVILAAVIGSSLFGIGSEMER